MNTFLILALLAVAAISTSATTSCTPGLGCQQQPCIQQQPLLPQQINPCKAFLQQQCSPMTLTMAVPFLRSQMLQQSICRVMHQQCCRQLVQIPEQSRCQAICSIVHAIYMEQQQQLSQGFFQPQQIAQFEPIRAMVMETLPTMCNVYVPPNCCSTTAAPLGGVATCAGGACF